MQSSPADITGANEGWKEEETPKKLHMTITHTPDMFRALLDDKTTDPHALAVQNYLHSFISRSVQRSHGDKLDNMCARVDDMAISTASRMQATDDLIQ